MKFLKALKYIRYFKKSKQTQLKYRYLFFYPLYRLSAKLHYKLHSPEKRIWRKIDEKMWPITYFFLFPNASDEEIKNLFEEKEK